MEAKPNKVFQKFTPWVLFSNDKQNTLSNTHKPLKLNDKTITWYVEKQHEVLDLGDKQKAFAIDVFLA